jgi:acyl transferase domain-containing protein
MSKPRALIVCPGRGSYTRDSLGYFSRYQGLQSAAKAQHVVSVMDAWRAQAGRPLVSALDQAKSFDPEVYLRGENGAALTFTATVADFCAVQDSFRPVAVVGNSMGWYTALGVAGALPIESAARLADELGNLQALGGGSQLIYPIIGDDWRPDPEKKQLVSDALAEAAERGLHAHLSISLGGYAVLAGDAAGLSFFRERLPLIPGKGGPSYPLPLPQHAAFHTSLMNPVRARAQEMLRALPWRAPEIPLVDGRGAIFRPRWADPNDIFAYTLGAQVTEPFDFTLSIITALQEYAPEMLVLLGPGETMGGPVGQILVSQGFFRIHSKRDFVERQEKDPLVFATARPGILKQLAGS